MSVQLQCAECGEELEAEIGCDKQGSLSIQVQPCKKCLEDAKEEEREEIMEAAVECP